MAEKPPKLRDCRTAVEVTIAWLSNPNTRATSGESPSSSRSIQGVVGLATRLSKAKEFTGMTLILNFGAPVLVVSRLYHFDDRWQTVQNLAAPSLQTGIDPGAVSSALWLKSGLSHGRAIVFGRSTRNGKSNWAWSKAAQWSGQGYAVADPSQAKIKGRLTSHQCMNLLK